MRIKYFSRFALLVFAVSALSGCGTFIDTLGGFWGGGIADLEKARDKGMVREYPLSCDAAFDRVLQIAAEEKLVIDQSDRKKGIIVIMNFPKQVDTTRVGVFLESVNSGRTKMTLSSASSTALAKAAFIIFGGLERPAGGK